METILKIVHLEDSPADAGLIERELKKAGLKFIIRLVETREQFTDCLENFNPDVIISDHSLPQFNSVEAMEIYKKYNPEIPFILVTGSVSEEFAITSIKSGADDYILKNNLIRLPTAIMQALKARKIESEKRVANQELEFINKELNTFIYKAAHDLRGPLCSIMGLVNVATQYGKNNEMLEYMQKISQSTHKLDTVLLSLMDAMAVKNVSPVLKEIDFESLLANLMERLKFVDGYEHVDFRITSTLGKGFFSDETILVSTLFTILENAIKYSQSAKPKPIIKITAEHIENHVRLEIEDNGIGIEEKLLGQIFDMYYKGHEFSGGSGLGLYVALCGAKKLGGVIDVKSELLKGSVFTVTLPAYLILM